MFFLTRFASVKKIIYLSILLFYQIPVYTQNIRVTGKVLDESYRPLPYAHITDVDSKSAVVADSIGNFIIFLNNPISILKASAVGYKDLEIKTTPKSILKSLVFKLSENNDLLSEMVISGTLELIKRKESPIPIAVYKSKFLNAVPSPSLVEATNQIAGLRPQLNCSVCNTGDIHINGMEGAYSMVVLDGMPIMGGLSTVYGLQGIPTSLIDQVEVIKGPASTVYGSEAMAGLINVVTKSVECIPKLTVDINFSNWGELQTSLSLKFLDKKRWKAFSAIDVFRYNNPIDNNEDNFTDLTLKNRYSIYNKFQFFSKNGANPLNISLRYLNENRWGGEMDWQTADRGKNTVYGESILTNRVEASSFYLFPSLPSLKWQTSFSWHDQKSWYGTSQYGAQQIIGFSQLTHHQKIQNKHQLLSGLALRYNNYNDNTPATLFPDIWLLPGAFIQDNYKLHNKHRLLMGWRTDYHDKHGFIHSPRINYQWDFITNSSIRLGYGNGFRVVNVFTEDHAALTGSREVVFLEELKPERSKNINFSMSNKWVHKTLNILLETSVFHSRFSNKIIPDFLTNDNQIIYKNLSGYAEAKGFSADLLINFKNIPLKLSVNNTFLDVANFEELSNGSTIKNRQLLAEKYSVKWIAVYSFEKLALDINYAATNYGPIRLPVLENDVRPEYSSPYTIHNLKIIKNLNRGWSTYIGVRNFTNFTPPNNSILRAFDPFDENIGIDNPNDYTFDASYMYASFQGINLVFGATLVF